MQRIKELRKQQKISQKSLADKLGVSISTVSGYENGQRTPPVETVKKMAAIFHVSVDYLVGATDNADVYPGPDTHLIGEDERRFVKEYRMLKPEDKRLFQQLMDRFPKRGNQ